MLLNIAPLRKNRDYRLLFIGQVVSFLGSMVSSSRFRIRSSR